MLDERELQRRLRDAAAHAGGADHQATFAAVDERITRRARSRRLRRGAGLATVVVVLAIGAALVPRDEPGGRVTAAGDPGPAAEAPAAPPSTQTWTTMAEAPIEGRFQHTAAAVDGRVLYFGGFTTGGRDAKGAALYDPATNRWEEVAAPPGHPSGSVAVTAKGRVYALDIDGALSSFDPSTEQWREEAHSPFRSVSNAVTGIVWTGEDIVVVNHGDRDLGTASFDPDTGTWTSLPAPPMQVAFFDFVWTGDSVLLVADTGGSGKSFPRLVILELELERGASSWRELPLPPLADVEHRTHGFATWTGTELVVGGGEAITDEGFRPTPRTDVAAWSPASRTWRSLAPAPTAVRGLERSPDLWTGSHVLVWAEETHHPLLLDPVANVWSGYDANSDGARQAAPVVWIHGAAVVWSGEPTGTDDSPDECCDPTAGGAVFRPSS